MNVSHPDYRSPFQSRYHGHNCFPEDTRGFLYYHSPAAGVPPAAGELRFRLTPRDDPASFDKGSDLQMETGLPWQIPLLKVIALSQIGRGPGQLVRKLLRDDGFLTPALLETCTAILNANKHYPDTGCIIHSFSQLFHIKFHRAVFSFWTLSMNQGQSFVRQGFYYDHPNRILPYSGEYTRIHCSYQFCLKVDHQVLLFAVSSGHISHTIEVLARL